VKFWFHYNKRWIDIERIDDLEVALTGVEVEVVIHHHTEVVEEVVVVIVVKDTLEVDHHKIEESL